MINFIICDDNDLVVQKVKEVVSNVMMKNNLGYNIKPFNDYNDKFMDFISNNTNCSIYILDIETPSRSGIDVAREIRKNDVNGMIIFLTGHEELGQLILKKELLFLSFINKFEDSMERLEISIQEALRQLNFKRVLQYEERGIIFNITTDEILYITRDGVDRKSIIKTRTSEFKTNKSLSEIHSMLDARFKQSHKSCIVNIDRIFQFNKQKRIITFDDGSTIDLISDKYKKDLIKVNS